jgi:hypothetical protein
LKAKVKEIIGEVNALKGQLEQRQITLEEFKVKKEALENTLRSILEKISEFKEKGTVETKKDAHLAEEAKRLMYEFQTEFPETMSKPKVFMSVTVVDHFVFDVDFSDYPAKPTLFVPERVQNLFDVPFETKLNVLQNWDTQNPPHITEIFYNIEQVFLKILHSEGIGESNLNQERVQKLLQRRRFLAAAEYEQGVKNYKDAIDLYQKVIELSYDLKDFERADKYSKIVADIKTEYSQ